MSTSARAQSTAPSRQDHHADSTLYAPKADLRWQVTQNIEGNVIAASGPSLRIGLAGVALLAAGGLAYAVGRQRGRHRG